MKLRLVVLVVFALGALAVGCKSEDAQVAEALRQELLAPVEAAKEAGDQEKLARHCLAVSMATEAPEVATQIEAGGESAEVAAKLAKLCEGAPSLSELVSEELEGELEKKGEAGQE